jgi:A/G-specific adenine glycosylase
VPKSNPQSPTPRRRDRKVAAPSLSRARLQAQLAAWFRKAARDLPWRRTRDPYAILVSEIMLQQTQVATVIPYYERWLSRFPDFATLAAADESEVLSVWQGLGYYSRARNLHRAAKTVVTTHGGEMPRDPALIRALPGIGRYTAGAVASFAFDLPEPLVDANVARVLARLLNLHTPIDSTAGQAALWSAAVALVPRKRSRIFNAALMELGAILCIPRSPQCLLCPIRKHCLAFAKGTTDSLPKKKPRRKMVALAEHCAWIVQRGCVLLEQQTGPRWRGLWKLPTLPSAPPSEPLHTFDYPFTHHRITLNIFTQPAPVHLRESRSWHPLATLAALPLTAPHRRAIEHLRSRQQCGADDSSALASQGKTAAPKPRRPSRTS